MEDKDKLKNDIEDVLNWGTPAGKNIDLLPELVTYTQTQKDAYTMIRQDTTTNALARVSSKSGMEIDTFADKGIIKTHNGKTDLQVIIQNYAGITLKQSTSKLLRLITIYFTENGSKDRGILVPLKKVMEDLGLKDVKTARSNIKKDLDALYNISCEAQIQTRKGEKIPLKFRIIDTLLDGTGIKNGIVGLTFSNAIYTHLKTCPLMVYNKNLLKIESNSQKNPYAFYLGDKVTELIKYNIYDKDTNEPKTSFITSVKTLLEVCIANGMTPYEDLKEGSRHVDKLIITPFIRDLTVCSEGFFKWHFCNKKGAPLTDEQMAETTPAGKYKASSYKEFIEQYIMITPLRTYPVAEFNEKKHNRAEKQEQKKAKKQKPVKK